jgi:hypothetical protein
MYLFHFIINNFTGFNSHSLFDCLKWIIIFISRCLKILLLITKNCKKVKKRKEKRLTITIILLVNMKVNINISSENLVLVANEYLDRRIRSREPDMLCKLELKKSLQSC